METLVYSGARAETNTKVFLEEQSHFIGWDICALGLPTSAAPFLQGSLQQRFEIYSQGKPELIERIALQAEDHDFRDSPAGFAGNSCNAIFVAGPFADDAELGLVQDKLVELCRTTSADQQHPGTIGSPEETSAEVSSDTRGATKAMMGVTRQGDWLVVRYLGNSATLAREAFVKSWCLVRPSLLGKEACLPRIWAC